ncbi:MAG: phosphate ABC transporter substrate-binding protein PstS, partial [Fimbriimonas ginsengisoli]|nr:phosphate ABC transporter substrate-binding protein PstS [Fimbriimonas ginsengisoli]
MARTTLCAGLALGILVAGCGGPEAQGGKAPAAAITINGAGSTFVNPAMSKWAYAYHEAKANTTVNYQSVGSGAGIAQYKAGTVDFGASDAPLSDKERGEMPTPTLHIPVTSGCEVLAYNIPNIGSGLKLSTEAIAGIFLGKIKTWNDPAIARPNPDLKLPAIPITVAHRSDGSGTTFIFTDYLTS